MSTVFTAASLIDGTGRDPITNAALVFENGRITQVGSLDSVSINAQEDKVIDVGNGVLLPGLIDCHCHLFYLLAGSNKPRGDWGPADTIKMIIDGMESARLWLSHGITTVRDVAASWNFDLGLRDLIAQGKAVGPRIFGSGQPLAMTGRALYHGMGIDVNSAEDARRAARQQLRAGADVIKLFASAGLGGGHQGTLVWESGWEQLTIEEMEAAIFEAHKAGRTATTHAIGTQSIKNAVQAGVDSVEHCTYLDDEALSMMKERDVVMVPTLAVGEVLAYRGIELGFPPLMEEYGLAAIEAGRKSVKMAYEAGLRIATGTDPTHGERVVEECICLNNAGLTPMDVIVAATRVGAELVQKQDDFGTLEVGKFADLIVVDGNPLEDLQALENVLWVVKEGQIYKTPEEALEIFSLRDVVDERNLLNYLT
jgi:imidazolonepropionase-like amidohydrolase